MLIQGPSNKRHVFTTLDGLRGIGAFLVVMFHYPGILGPIRLPHTPLVVDFFFMLSGFVLTFAYQERLDGGLPTSDFMKARLLRLYPLYGFAVVLSFVGEGFVNTRGPASMLHFKSFGWLLYTLLALPYFQNIWLYPLNHALWSVSFEAVGNFAHAWLFRRRSWQFIAACMLTGALLVCVLMYRIGDISQGAKNPYALWGLARLLFGYTAGMLLYRVWKSGWMRVKVSTVWAVALLLVVLGAPVTGTAGIFYDLGCLFVVLPVLILVCASAETPRVLTGTLQKLGMISYAVYLLQMPIYDFFCAIRRSTTGRPVGPDNLRWGIPYLGVLVGMAFLLDWYYEPQARAWMTRKLKTRKPMVAAKTVEVS